MQFTPEHLSPPTKDLELDQWFFSADLRKYFPNLESNYEISDLLEQRRVIYAPDGVDSESACFYAYFQTPENALNFISRLNTVPEIQNYVEPIRPNPDEQYIAMSISDWNRIRAFMHANISQELRDTLTGIYIFDVEL